MRVAFWTHSLKLLLRGWIMKAAFSVVPSTGLAVVFGKPDFEENSLVWAACLADSYDGAVVLLGESEAELRRNLNLVSNSLGIDSSRVRVVEKRRSLLAVWLFVRAELVAYTHGVFGTPATAGRRLHINLWHGTGPKRTANSEYDEHCGAAGMSGSVVPWLRSAMEDLHMSAAVALPGNVRQDLLHRPAPDEVLERLGLDVERPFVVWAPTYRLHESITVAGADGRPMSELASESGSVVEVIASAASAHDVQVIVKPHPADVDDLDVGIGIVTSSQIWESGATLYQVLGRAAGVISDYSSIWVDYLEVSDGSVGLLCPDIDVYREGRGLAEPALDSVAGSLFLNSRNDVDEYFRSVSGGSQFRPESMRALLRDIEYRPDEERRLALWRAIGSLPQSSGLRGWSSGS